MQKLKQWKPGETNEVIRVEIETKWTIIIVNMSKMKVKNLDALSKQIQEAKARKLIISKDFNAKMSEEGEIERRKSRHKTKNQERKDLLQWRTGRFQ